MTTLFGGRDCYKGVTDCFPLLFFHKKQPNCPLTGNSGHRATRMLSLYSNNKKRGNL